MKSTCDAVEQKGIYDCTEMDNIRQMTMHGEDGHSLTKLEM